MRSKAFIITLSVIVFIALVVFIRLSAKNPLSASPVVARVNGCEITVDEFEEGFSLSAFAARDDRLQARREYLETVIDQRLILLDAQKRNIDKAPDFLKSVERFWAQSLLTVALGQKTMELRRGVTVRDEDIQRIYESMVKDGVTTKPFKDVYPQIKWQAEKQLEVQVLNSWVKSLRKNAGVSVDINVLKSLK